ncbi:hypothetical protein JHN59_00050 [Streptomyces sp. MBT49]|uniref:hypothetical protein n=1 Tax=Streptomyces sp. MBT49 TaxID=1488380 RepID=UPI00190C8FDB|nr:hypothetical protein [Streptomyces sp. MBT49]MBK3623268.1 hypothetical protein [Streptomyces sp. MBT49]
MHRRKLLTGLAATATAPFLGSGSAQADETLLGELLVARLRDAMLGLGAATPVPSSEALSTDFTHALADFDACRYASLAVRLPRLIRAGHAPSTGSHDTEQSALLAKSYLLATRMLVKMDEQQLGWMAVDRARQLAEAAGDVLAVAESARQVAVLARRAGWHDRALSIALSAADNPDLRGIGRAGTAVRGLLVQTAQVAAQAVSPAGCVAFGSDGRVCVSHPLWGSVLHSSVRMRRHCDQRLSGPGA